MCGSGGLTTMAWCSWALATMASTDCSIWRGTVELSTSCRMCCAMCRGFELFDAPGGRFARHLCTIDPRSLRILPTVPWIPQATDPQQHGSTVTTAPLDHAVPDTRTCPRPRTAAAKLAMHGRDQKEPGPTPTPTPFPAPLPPPSLCTTCPLSGAAAAAPCCVRCSHRGTHVGFERVQSLGAQAVETFVPANARDDGFAFAGRLVRRRHRGRGDLHRDRIRVRHPRFGGGEGEKEA